MDSFARDNLPPPEDWPDLLIGRPPFDYPGRLNCVAELVDAAVTRGWGERTAFRTDSERWTYVELAEKVARIGEVLTHHCGLRPGGRVLLRAPNTPLMIATYLAIIRAGGIAVATMPLLRLRELAYILDKARIALAICDHRLLPDLEAAQAQSPVLGRIVPLGGDGPDDLTALMAAAQGGLPHDTASDDVCLIAFTSGTTGEPKGTVHFHRDMLAICDAYGAQVLRARPDDVFIGTAPIAFTFGLGAVVLFPLRIGASAVLIEQGAPDSLLAAIRAHRPTVCFTAPTGYRALLGMLGPGDTESLRICVSAGETLPAATWHAWHRATGIRLMDGIGSTEMLHIFLASPVEQVRPGSVGFAVPGYEAKLIDAAGRDLPPGSTGRLAVRGPTGCRYLADARQTNYVVDGWNVTGDTFHWDEDGYFSFQARSDDMIVSSGYNIAGPEVEAVILLHPDVAECAVVGAPDEARGALVKAVVVPKPGVAPGPALARAIQDWVKAEIAPYKYPRIIEFSDTLPKTESGKLQRFRLR